MNASRPPRASSFGPQRPGYLVENELAARWSRSVNTLVGWRTRQQAGRGPIAVELLDGGWYYSFDEIRRVEQDPAYAWVRPLDERSKALPPLSLLEQRIRASAEAAAPQIPLGLTVPVERKFVRVTEYVHGAQLLAVADDGTAWVSVGMMRSTDDFAWHQLPALPAREVPSIQLTPMSRAS